MPGSSIPAGPLATIDVGTNTALLLVATVRQGRLHILHEEERFVRLGEGVDASGCITAAALGRLVAVLRDYRAKAEALGATQHWVAGTSASRDAENKDALIASVRRETGLEYKILTGEEEAVLSFAGVTSALEGHSTPCAVIDIGGGSTEVIVGRPGGSVVRRYSLDVGAVRLTERFFRSAPPAPGEVEKAEAFVVGLLDALEVKLDAGMPLIGAAGTVTGLARVRDGRPRTVSHDAAPLTAAQVRSWRHRLLRLSTAEVTALNPSVMRGRADVFPAGVLILDAVLQRYGLPACGVSARGLRHGLALHVAKNAPC